MCLINLDPSLKNASGVVLAKCTLHPSETNQRLRRAVERPKASAGGREDTRHCQKDNQKKKKKDASEFNDPRSWVSQLGLDCKIGKSTLWGLCFEGPGGTLRKSLLVLTRLRKWSLESSGQPKPLHAGERTGCTVMSLEGPPWGKPCILRKQAA